jgi:polyisoprenoid-binding protein YceI
MNKSSSPAPSRSAINKEKNESHATKPASPNARRHLTIFPLKSNPRTLLVSLAASLPLLCAPFALAQHQAFNINPDASTVTFTLNSTHEVTHGTFHVEKGTVTFDRATPALSGLIVVSAASGNTGNASRDKKMLNDILQAPQFSDVTFAPQTYTGTLAPTGDSTLQVTGIFTLHGAPHPLTVPMQMHIEGNKLTAKTTFEVPYIDWGLKDPSWFVLKVSKAVEVNLTLIGFLSPAN